jgi:hypothetical protein
MQAWYQEKNNLFEHLANLKKNIHSTEWTGYSNISAKAHNGNDIIFYVSNESSNNNGFISFSVIYFYEFRPSVIDEKNIDGLFVTGKEVNYFYTPARAFESKIYFKDQKLLSTSVNMKQEKEIVLGSYKYQNVDITISIYVVPTFHSNSDTPLTAQSKMNFRFSKSQNLDFTIDVFQQCQNFFFYICGRTNVKFDDIYVYKIINSIRNNDGIIRITSKEIEEEKDLKRSTKIIKYEYLKEKTCLLFSAIAEDAIYLQNLCSSIQATHSFDTARIILNFVAFEREFRNLYNDDTVRSNEYDEIKNKILQHLEILKEKNTGKKKKYVKSFINLLRKTENKYGDRMSKALSDCEEILLPFLRDNYKSYETKTIEEICSRMNKLRNDSAHGNIDLQIKCIHMADFVTLENLLYAMRLKSIGVELYDIQKSIKNLKNYNIHISEKE